MFKRNQTNKGNGLDLLRDLRAGSVTQCWFDPQYRHLLDEMKFGNEGAREKRRFELPAMSETDIRSFMFEHSRVLRPAGYCFLWMDKFILAEAKHLYWTSGMGLKRVDLLTWRKPRMGMGKRTRRVAEYLLVLQKAPCTVKSWVDRGIPDVIDGEPYSSMHPHSKPIWPIQRIIAGTTKPGNLIVDAAAGSYAVLAAAKAVRREFLGCDLDNHVRHRGQ